MADPDEYEIPDPSKLAGSSAAPGSGDGELDVAAGVQDELMAIPGVVMVGIGQDEIGNTALIVGVRTAGDLANVPARHAGLPVRAEVIGDVEAL